MNMIEIDGYAYNPRYIISISEVIESHDETLTGDVKLFLYLISHEKVPTIRSFFTTREAAENSRRELLDLIRQINT